MEETIELREIIDILLKGKWLIAICTIIAMLLSGIVSWFVLEEQYESEAVLQISSDIQDTGIMASYVATEFTPNIYVQRLGNVEQNRKYFKEKGYNDYTSANLSTSVDLATGIVNLTYSGTSPKNAQELLTLLMDKTKNEMNSKVKTNLHLLEQTYFKESEILSTEIEQLMSQYNSIIVSNKLPEILILQTIATSQFVLNLTTEQSNALSNVTGAIQNELLQLKVQIDTKSNEYREVLAKYQSVKTGLDSFKADPFIRVIIDPTLAEFPTSPNKVLNLAIGLVLGLMIGISLVFFRSYWKTSATK
ncbi:Wzz/FepE/Etk N-terminal domain-containing protein [Metasolibacillus fluoroglycofenilyticus]|uniref:Wzz/FepE/Etk N-terminal domain-containing protein n=1 Tax=Metasolibacillus fluoroglycofenilyticus TaxID=1239396 RepID=UPI000D3BAF57|nr:Wzz/FepE/Etk N-terminal domain-containing protein [Metasolibacillus fluoroglycofenilyticus]